MVLLDMFPQHRKLNWKSWWNFSTDRMAGTNINLELWDRTDSIGNTQALICAGPAIVGSRAHPQPLPRARGA